MANYVTNEELIEELKKYKETKVMSEELGGMILKIAKSYAQKGNFKGYTWKDDMIGDAVLTCVRYINKFDLERGSNPFAYITTICKNSYINFIKKQQKHSRIKNKCFAAKDMFNDNETLIAINYSIINIAGLNEEETDI